LSSAHTQSNLQLSQDVPLWKEFSGRMNWNTKRNNNAQSVTRTFYVQKFLSFRLHKKQAEEREMEEMKRQRRARNIDHSASAMLLLLFARPYEWICTVALILFTIFGVLKLDENINWHWGVVFIPMLVVVYQMFFAPLVYDILRSHFTYDFEDELAPEKTMRPIFFFLFFLMPLQSGRPLHRFLVFAPIISLVLFILLLLVRLSGVAVMWWLVFLPLLVFGIYMVILPHMVHRHPTKWLDHVVPSFASLLLFLFFLFLFLKVDGVLDWSWFVVMVPLFILKGFLICAPMLMTFFSYFCCSFWMVDHSRWPGDAGAYCIVAAAVAVLILGPLLAFEVLMAQRLEGVISTSYSLIFIPIFLLEGIGVCGCCALNLVVLFE